MFPGLIESQGMNTNSVRNISGRIDCYPKTRKGICCSGWTASPAPAKSRKTVWGVQNMFNGR